MEELIINHSDNLKGTVYISGAKNSALPIMAATILIDGCSTLKNIPNLADIEVMKQLLTHTGIRINEESSDIVKIDVGCLNNFEIPYELCRKIRASILLLGPMLAKIGKVSIPLPGGCAIGNRPIDLHLKGLVKLGAEIEQSNGSIIAKASKLIGAKIYLDFPSVGATENLIMASVLAEGETILENVAIEPEIVDLAMFLSAAGAEIYGAGTDTIKIMGVKALKPIEHTVIPDRIEAGTLMVATAMVGGDVTLNNVITSHLKPITAKLKEAGVEISEELSNIRIKSTGKLKAIDIKTLPYPGFPTDMQAQFVALMSKAEGNSIAVETIFENRFMYVPELIRMGANIKIDGRSAVIEGKEMLNGAKVKATDLRAGASLILAGMVSEGITNITDIYHIDRGYDGIDKKLKSLGANIERVTKNE
ncbi:MAG: UDP-N-acetylglucosamine 1-carboxyvinyltransferase [Clostridiales bacterium]|nr:UDP-N-acetylglucosamine 1-carboxyvinyltransferase [Clostridiales bacterium]